MDRLLQMVLKTTVRGLNYFLVRLWPVLRQLMIFCFYSSLLALAAVWVGWGPATERIANEWVKRMASAPIPTEVIERSYPLARFLAFWQILFGWIFLAHFTVLFTNALLRYYTGHWINF